MPKENKSAGLLTHNLNLENENLSKNDKEGIKDDKKNEINDLGEFGDSDYHEFKEKITQMKILLILLIQKLSIYIHLISFNLKI